MAIDSRAPPFLIRVHPLPRGLGLYMGISGPPFQGEGLEIFSIINIAIDVKFAITNHCKTSPRLTTHPHRFLASLQYQFCG